MEFSSSLFIKKYDFDPYQNLIFATSQLFESEQYAVELSFEHTRMDTVPFPYIHWRRKPYQGKYINIDALGIRRTLNNSADPDAKKVLVFGGSTVWGTGAEDKDTIPSLLARELNSRGKFQVVNMGETAYFSTQEVIAFHLELLRGNVPDFVVFVDGVNDIYATGYSPGDATKFQHYSKWYDFQTKHFGWDEIILEKWRESYLHELFQYYGIIKKPEEVYERTISPAEVDESAKRVVSAYEMNKNIAASMAKLFDVDAYFFWQPFLLSGSKKNLSAREQQVIAESSPVIKDLVKKTYALMKSRPLRGVTNLSSVFDAEGPIYIDMCHTGKTGNQIIARHIAKAIIDAP